jgi:fermentation-respiration switch protein FrsA (DUF1100 family)
VASYLALAKREYRNPLVLDSTFTLLREAPSELNPVIGLISRLVLGDAYDTLSRMKIVEPKVLLVFHSKADEVVPYRLGEQLFKSYDGGPKFFFELQGLHMEYTYNQGTYADAIYKHISNMRPILLNVPGEDIEPEKVEPGSPIYRMMRGEEPQKDDSPGNLP